MRLSFSCKSTENPPKCTKSTVKTHRNRSEKGAQVNRSPQSAAATIEDVALQAGVSMATVSRALRGMPNVAEATRDRVLSVAKALNYRPDPHASRLAAGRTHAVGMAVPWLGRWYFSQVVSGARDAFAAAGYDLLLFGVGSGEERSRFVHEWGVLDKRVDGLLLVDLRLDPAELDAVRNAGTTVVSVGDRYDDFPSVTVDNNLGAAVAVQHLLNLGHREIGLIGDMPGPLPFSVPSDRRDGWAAALTEADLQAAGRFTVDGGHRAMTQLLAARKRPTAVFAMSDEMAMGAIKAVRDHGLSVPDDLSIVGFDGHELAEVMELTTVSQPVVESGRRAGEFLLRTIKGKSTPNSTTEVPHEVMPTELIARRTSAPLRAKVNG
jgi:LacI family transcriptional regulator, repressor for deo operon, udp, cdd, tsx, nupC, and nupG